MPTFVLPLQDLDESGRDWHFPVSTTWLSTALAETELRAVDDEEGTLSVQAQRNGLDVLVQGRIGASLLAMCARCLEDVPLKLDLPISALFSPEHTRPSGASEEEIEVRLDETTRDYYGGSEIVLDSWVREHILLEVPMKPLCSDDCAGIAVPAEVQPPEEAFGNSALDARFAPLLKFKEELTKKEE
ncbi:MAG: YceD family protein [Myxococcota bacterium]